MTERTCSEQQNGKWLSDKPAMILMVWKKIRDFMIGDPFFCVILISTCNYELFPHKRHLWINTIFAPWVHVCQHDDTISRYGVKYFVSACDFLLIESTIITKWLYSAKIISINE